MSRTQRIIEKVDVQMQRSLSKAPLVICALALMLGYGLTAGNAISNQGKVILMRTPDGGIQPQAVVDDSGAVHLIYFKGSPAAGDIFYVRKAPQDANFSKAIRVNSQPNCVIALGNIRGAHIAVGRGGRIHVAWMGSKEAEPKGPSNAAPMLYTRLNDALTGFEPQRNVMQFAVGLDGGGSIAADRAGNVYVAWHAGAGEEEEAKRRVWVARSADEGKTFKREVSASDKATGACGCCGMRAFAARNNAFYMLYRAATESVDRDMYLVASKDNGTSFQSTLMHKWKLEACPMSTAAIGESRTGILVAWETVGQVYYSKIDPGTSKPLQSISAPGASNRRKHPAVIDNAQDETLLVWTEKMGWQRGGSLAWQIFDKQGQPTAEKGQAEGVPVWSLVTVYARPDGSFTIVY